MILLGAVALSSVMYVLLYPPFGWTALSWVTLVPFYLALSGRRPAAAAGLAALLGWGVTVGIVAWLVPTLHQHFEKPLGFAVGFLIALGVVALSPYLAASYALFARAAPRVRRCALPVLFAAAWVASEWLRALLGVRSPWAFLGDAHFDSVRLRQVADLAGVYGVSAVVAFGNAVLAEGIRAAARWRSHGRAEWREAGFALGVFALVLATTLAYGEARRHSYASEAQRHGDAFRVALVQGNVDARLRWKRVTASRVLHRYGGMTRDLLREDAATRPDLVIWPENAIQTAPDDPHLGRPIAALARRGVPLLIGAPRDEVQDGTRRHFNSAFLVRSGAALQHYDKRRLLPFSETKPFGSFGGFGSRGDLDAGEYASGSRPGIFGVGTERLAVLICMEALYPDLGREARRAGATALVNLSNDGWYVGRGGAAQHLQQVTFRAIESGLPLIRATTTGISAVVAPDGRVVTSLGPAERAVLRAELPPPRAAATLYARVGDLFALACLGLTLAAPLIGRWRARS